jgi:hypothetical protein
VVGNDHAVEGDEGYSWLVENLGGRWVKTSYNSKIRKNYAEVGGRYDEQLDAFIPFKRFESWVLNEETCQWEPPIPRPDEENSYLWDEDTTSWVELSPQEI